METSVSFCADIVIALTSSCWSTSAGGRAVEELEEEEEEEDSRSSSVFIGTSMSAAAEGEDEDTAAAAAGVNETRLSVRNRCFSASIRI